MPIYEYECPTCHRTSEVIQKFDDPSPTCGDCEVNGQPSEMVKLISKGGTFILKGSGWADSGYTKKK